MINEVFSNSFWPPAVSTESVPRYQTGLSVLDKKLDHSVIENEMILSFLKKRVDIEKKCASMLVDSNRNEQDVEDDMFANLKNAFEVVQNESEEAAHCHRIRAGIIEQEVIVPLSKFTRTFKSDLDDKRGKIRENIEEFEHAMQSVLMIRAVYWSRCRALEMADPEFRPPVPPGFKEEDDEFGFDDSNADDAFVGGRQRSSSVSSELNIDRGGVRLGKRTELPYREVARLMCRMQKMIEPIPRLSLTVNTVSKYMGQSIFEWVRDYCAAPVPGTDENVKTTIDEESLEICKHLVALNFLNPVAKGNKTRFSVNSEYEIQRNVVDRYLRKTRIRRSIDSGQPDTLVNDNDVENIEVQAPDIEPSSPSLLDNFFQHFKLDHKKQETYSMTKSQMEMKEADKTYKQKVQVVEEMRKHLEENILEYLDDMQSMEEERIETIKHVQYLIAFIKFSSTLFDTLGLFKDTYNRIILFQETLKPQQDIQYIIEQYQTGPFCPRPLIYDNYYYGSATDQLFGVPLEEVSQVYGSYVPPIVSEGLKLIDAVLAPVVDRETKFNHIWTDILPLKQVNIVCKKLDGLSGSTLKSTMQTMDSNELANAIRFYLLELPECLLTNDLYDPVKLLYASPQETDSRLVSISKLLATLPSANYHTLRVLSNHFYRLLKDNSSKIMLDKLVAHFSYVLLRPQKSTILNTHDHHPKRLVRDLFTKYHIIFTSDINRAQKSGATRTAIVADNQLLTVPEENKLPSPTTSVSSNSSDNKESALRRTLNAIIHPNTTHANANNIKVTTTSHTKDIDSPGSLIVPRPQIALFDDPDDFDTSSNLSQEYTPLRYLSPNILTDNDSHKDDYLNLMLDLEDEVDAAEIAEKDLDPQKLSPRYGRSRASTKTSMDNINLDPFFSDD
ncbi:hypothetical protein K501DRAFT_279874 [Backusella circina FSU 941]|nr:hypothetical protein K501DRAFT_279874 [Backusella circina FSU 941]